MDNIDNIQLDPDNKEFNEAVRSVLDGNGTTFLTGKAGTGKTTFLKHIQRVIDRPTIVVAPTGVAAINAGGVTMHSFFGIPLSIFFPGDPRLREYPTSDSEDCLSKTFHLSIQNSTILAFAELLIIDEVSTVRVDLIDVIDKLLRDHRGNNAPFGGMKVLLVGDLFQLPPVVKNEEWEILSQFYETPYFFSARVFENNYPKIVELKKIYRQTDTDFINLLNRVRVDAVTQGDITLLNTKYKPSFISEGNTYITLATHRKAVSWINTTKLKELDTKLFMFNAEIRGEFPENSYPTDEMLFLKVGAQVMILINDPVYDRFHNGKIGRVVDLTENSVTVGFDDGSSVCFDSHRWENIRYRYNSTMGKIEKEVVGEFYQIPLKLAWAITVHKSQGLAFDKVVLDVEHAFAPGQVYVALSRCKSLDGLVLKSRINRFAIKTDPRIIAFLERTNHSPYIKLEP